jgi:hypothetical protein
MFVSEEKEKEEKHKGKLRVNENKVGKDETRELINNLRVMRCRGTNYMA